MQHGDHLWLRGPDADKELSLSLRQIPGAERFAVSPDGMLTPVGSLLPLGALPDGPWQPIGIWFAPAPQPASLAGQPTRLLTPRLVRGGHEAAASVLITTLAEWSAYAQTAPRVRLQRLQFAAGKQKVIVRGNPLPTLPGRRYVEREGIAHPCGFEFSPSIDPAIIRSRLGTQPADLALFAEDGSWQHIAADDFLLATRANMRATAAVVKAHPDDYVARHGQAT